ncbi:MAG TPA: rhomboid family intramembrane serine protease [Marinilabiliaceae bacterium]|nr:rhomboid family intramembrane serine protease [Marinilabiliaceae bacterium]
MSITLIIILVTAAVSIPAFNNRALFYKFDFAPYAVDKNKEWYRFLTHAFLHGDWMHLIFNMLVLFFFGDVTQHYFEAYAGVQGTFYFILLYLGGVAFAVLPTYKKHKSNTAYHSVGASGAVSAVLFSSVIFSPASSICLWGILCFPGIVWAIIYLVYSYTQGKKGGDYINHDAHFWGAIYGVVLTFLTVPRTFLSFFEQIWRLLSF